MLLIFLGIFRWMFIVLLLLVRKISLHLLDKIEKNMEKNKPIELVIEF